MTVRQVTPPITPPNRIDNPDDYDQATLDFRNSEIVMADTMVLAIDDINAEVVTINASATLASQYAEHPEDTEIPVVGGNSALHHAAKAAADAAQTALDRIQTGTDAATSLAAAAAAQSGAGLPALVGKARYALVVNAAEDGVEYEALPESAKTFEEVTTSATWTKPDNLLIIYVEVTAGGGGGGVDSHGVVGGGGGECVGAFIDPDDVPASLTITIGAGGAGFSDASASGDGIDGGDTSFGALLTARGGKRGGLPSTTAADMVKGFCGDGSHAGFLRDVSGQIGHGSPPSQGAGAVSAQNGAKFNGGGSSHGGGGGGSNGSSGGVSQRGGNGGDGGEQNSTTATGGAVPGGGGGSVRRFQIGSLTAGDGANGTCRIWALVNEDFA